MENCKQNSLVETDLRAGLGDKTKISSASNRRY